MSPQRKYPRDSPRDVLKRLLKVERDTRQLLADVQSCNDNNPYFRDEPMDLGIYLVRVKTIKEVIANVRASIARGEPKLPSGILKPLLKDW